MPFTCCKRKNEASKEFVIEKWKRPPRTFEVLVLDICDDFVSGSGKYGTYPLIRFTPSTNEGMVKVGRIPDFKDSDDEKFFEASMNTKLSKTDGLIDLALRWFKNYFESGECTCSSLFILLGQSMTSNPDFIWSHECFKSSKVNCLHTLGIRGNGEDQNPFVFDFPEKFFNQFPNLKTLVMESDVNITESCLLTVKLDEIEFETTQFPEETIYTFIKTWIEGENVHPEFKKFTFCSAKIEESIVKNLKSNVDGAILWEDDKKTARVAKKIFQKREKQYREKESDIELLEFDPRKTFQFEQKNSEYGKKPVTATLLFYEEKRKGIFVKCGILDSSINIKKNTGGRPNNAIEY